MRRSFWLASCAGLALAAGAARADTQAVPVPTTVGTAPGPSGFNYYQGPGNYTFSFDFTAKAAIDVTQLGYYNSALTGQPNTGGFGSHLVTLFDVTTNATLASATVTSTSPVTGAFNYAPIAPVALNTTDTYQVSGTMTTQYYLVDLNQSVAPLPAQIGYIFTIGDIFGNNSTNGTYSDFGPNFQFSTGAACTQNRAGINVIALSGDACTAAPGAYNPTTSSVTLPVTYNGFGFYAHGGSIDSPGNVSITTTDPNGTGGSHAIWADGTGSRITLEGTTTVTAGGANSYGVYASGGGVVSATGAVSVTTTGAGATGLYVTGAGSLINATLGAVSTSGARAFGAQADTGGGLTLTNGSITTGGAGSAGLVLNDAGTVVTATNVAIATNGGIDAATNNHANGVYNGPGTGTSGGTLTLNNVSVTTAGFESSGVATSDGGTSTITGGTFSTSGENAGAVVVLNSGQLQISGATLTASGLGSPGLIINGSGGSIVASNLTISTTGQTSTATGSHGNGVYNGSFGSYSGGGMMSITDSSVSTSGDQAYGVLTGAGGTTTYLGGSISTTGAQANAALANAGSLTIGLDATGHGTTISTSGAGSYAVSAVNGGYLSVTGATIATTNNGSGGVGVNGTGSEVDATNVTISTAGAYDAASSFHAYGAYNGPNGNYTSGGVLKLTNVSVSTQGAGMYGVYTNTGGVTTFNGGSVITSGVGAHGLYAANGGSLTATNVTVATSGAGAFGAYASGGASLTLAGTTIATLGANSTALVIDGAGSMATIDGAVSLSATGGGATALSLQNGGGLTLNGALTINAPGGLTINAGSTLTSPGSLSLTTTANGAALTLSGNNATFAGTGGGVIDAAGTAIALLNGTSQSARFTNYQINSLQGDLIFADPSTSAVNFTNTTANAGTGNLADVTNGSNLTLNATGSALIGVVTTTVGSVSNVNLQNGSTWTITGPSTVTNLSLNNSSASFASAGGFKTLTTTNYAGTNATLTFNAAFGGTNPGADQLVINGGRATGTTVIAVNPLGTATGRTSVPLVTTTNGGTIAPGAFTLSGPLVVGGLVYTLQDQTGAENLVTAPGVTSAQASGSLATLAQSRQTQAITGHVLGSILTGATEQINCSACSSGFASFGSFALGAHGRWTLTPSVTLLAGLSYDSYSGRGVTVNNALLGALALRYDPAQLGRYRPFLEAGLLAEPYANVSFRRSYASSMGGGVGVGDTLSRSVAAYGRIGYIWRLSRIDEAAVYTDLTKSWQWEAGYVESAGAGNPFAAAVAPSLDTMNVWRLGAQYTHLFGEHVEADVSVGYAQAFAANYGSTAAFAGLGAASGAAPSSFGWGELGGRVSYRFSRNVTGDVFVLGTVGAEPAGDQVHGGVALRMAF